MATGKKRGPKTDNPKIYEISIKLDAESRSIIDAYKEQESISAAETVRRGIKRLKSDLKK